MNKMIFHVSLMKTLYFNVYYFPIKQAIKLPVLVGRKMKLKNMGARTSVRINCEKIKTGMVHLGLPYGSFDKFSGYGYWSVSPNGKVTFGDNNRFKADNKIVVVGNGELTFGTRVSSNSGFIVSCSKSIRFGDNVLMGWDITIIDEDGHKIYDCDGRQINERKSITIGNDVWIAKGVTLLKGTEIPNGSIIGARSILSKKYEQEKSLIVGNPGCVVKSNVTWER